MKLLIVGGTGNISWRLACAALEECWTVTLLNRGGPRRAAPPGCQTIACDIRDKSATEAALGATCFDVVIDFLCFNGQQALDAMSYFSRRTQHYVFISTTAVYDRSIARQPLTEDCPQIVEGWDYALAKAHAERTFARGRERDGFPVTVIRPAHTYDVIIPEAVGNADWTNPWRALNGKPIVLHGDGTTFWTLTHSVDLANAIVALLKSKAAMGQTYHITSDEIHTWKQITAAVYAELGIAMPSLCYRTTADIDRISPRLGNGLKGHKMWCDVYDNAKFKAACPSWRASVSLEAGVKEALDHYRNDERLRMPNRQLDAVLDEICAMG